MSSKDKHTAEGIAFWLFENTSLSFRQIADFCNLPERVIEIIADGELDEDVMEVNPIEYKYVTEQDIKSCEIDETKLLPKPIQFGSALNISTLKKQKSGVVSKKRRDKPDAVAWIIDNFPEINDYHIMKLINTTRDTIDSIRNKRHWNMENIVPRDPVILGLCNKSDFEQVLFKVRIASERNTKLKKILNQSHENQTKQSDINSFKEISTISDKSTS
jgi:hypothetical protein